MNKTINNLNFKNIKLKISIYNKKFQNKKQQKLQFKRIVNKRPYKMDLFKLKVRNSIITKNSNKNLGLVTKII